MNAITQTEATQLAAAFTQGNPAASIRYVSEGVYDFEAGQRRVQEHRSRELDRFARMREALQIIRKDVHSEGDLVECLHALAHSFAEHQKITYRLTVDREETPTTKDAEDVLDKVTQAADDIEFRNEAQG